MTVWGKSVVQYLHGIITASRMASLWFSLDLEPQAHPNSKGLALKLLLSVDFLGIWVFHLKQKKEMFECS
jgi:hypothetical protein